MFGKSRPQFKIGDRVRITAKGISVVGEIKYVSNPLHANDTYLVSITDDHGMPYYWKEKEDKGTIERV